VPKEEVNNISEKSRYSSEIRSSGLSTLYFLFNSCSVIYEYNGVEVEGAFSCKQTFVGKGAGSHPTGSAVLSDISALTYNYRYAYKKLKKLSNGSGKLANGNLLDNDFSIKVYIRYRDKAELNGLEILEVEEEYRSNRTNYLVATVRLSSLLILKGNRESKVFVCAI